MIKHIFVNKCNTIYKDSEYNTGLNPVCELNSGKKVSRFMIDFDFEFLKRLYEADMFPDMGKARFSIVMKNCGLDAGGGYGDGKKRSSSFDILAMKMPRRWDSGKGYDYERDFYKENHRSLVKNGSSWYQAMNGKPWDEEGVYSEDEIQKDIAKEFNNEPCDIIIGRQHFDFGTEDMYIDITDYIKNTLTSRKAFNGILLTFDPFMNLSGEDEYAAFFSNQTNTMYNPYIEVEYDDQVMDDRACFGFNRKNRLYFYSYDNGLPVNLDHIPSCTVEGEKYEVKHGGIGSYYIEISIRKGKWDNDTILYDTWSDIVLNGVKQDDVEMKFVVSEDSGSHIGSNRDEFVDTEPAVYGIGDKEEIEPGDVRTVWVEFRKRYSSKDYKVERNAEYRIYTETAGNRQVDIVRYQPIDTRDTENTFMIDTQDFVPGEYHIDIRVRRGREMRYFRKVLTFTIVNNTTHMYI